MQITPLDDDSYTVSALPYAPEESIQPKWAFFRTLLEDWLDQTTRATTATVEGR